MTPIDNITYFNGLLEKYPPEFDIGDDVRNRGNRYTIIGRVFNEREKCWKYSARPFGLSMIIDFAVGELIEKF